MCLAALSLCVALLGADENLPQENPHQRFLEQKEWYGYVACRIDRQRSRRTRDGGSQLRVSRSVEIDFRIEVDKDYLAYISNWKENAKALAKRGIPLPRQAVEGMKAMEAKRVWRPDPKKQEQHEVLRLRDSIRTWDRCGGGEGCQHGGVDHCSVVSSDKRSYEGDAQPQSVAGAFLSVDIDKGTFDFRLKSIGELVVHATQELENPEDDTKPTPPYEVTTGLGFGNVDVKGLALPPSGLLLTGDEPVTVEFEGRQFRGTLSWTLSPKPLRPVDLKFEIEDYETWRPKGSQSETDPGADIRIRAWLESRGGGAPEEKAKAITFRIDDVSNEPGICINYPMKPQNPPDMDLKFMEEWNGGFDIEGGGSVAKRQAEGLTETVAVLSSFDWGAFGRLEVQAKLESGRLLIGELKGSEGVSEARIPKSSEGSWIADVWKKNTGATGDDDADDDAEPVGDARYKGDGLTLYEEYRGWHEWGQRKENEFEGGGDPNTKELFVCDQTGCVTSEDLEAFHTLTGLRVIGELMESELTRDRVVNFNHAEESRHYVAQHGVVVRATGGLGEGTGSTPDHEAGTPGWRGLIFLQTGAAGPTSGPEPLLERFSRRRTLIHELLHSCNVRHHAPVTAEERTGVRWTLSKDEENQPCLMEGAQRIRVLRESDGTDVTSAYLEQLSLPGSAGFILARVGSWQGSGSGHPYCVMVAGNAKYFRSRIDPRVRYLIRPDERARSALFICDRQDAPSGSDNADNHAPEAHFGRAPKGGGDCLHQIVVNDGASPRSQ